jgi:hypothetical protein
MVIIVTHILVSFVLLGIYVNYFVVILLGIMFLSLPLMGKLGMAIGNSRFKLQQSGDKRLKMINELLQGQYRIASDNQFQNLFCAINRHQNC